MEGSSLQLLHPRVREAAERLGYKRLLPIQEKAIPVVLRERHTIITAPTGSGKTEAALFPVLSMLLSKRETRGSRGLEVIYVTPLRALNRDVELRIKALTEELGLSVKLRHGDTTQAMRRMFLENPPDIAVTTPETLNLLLTLKQRKIIFGGVSWVIVDEVHELLDNKRGGELSVTLERLEKVSAKRVQRIGLSATLSRSSLREAAVMLAGERPVEVVSDDGSKEYSIGVEVVEEEDYWKEAVERVARLIEGSKGSVLIFTNTRSTAEMLGNSLARLFEENGKGYRVEVHHGSLARDVREKAERDFREGRVKALVATSSMELGIDIGSVDLVVQFMSPRQVIAMAQRAGRAGHRINEVSRGVIVTPSNLYEALESGVISVRTEKGHLEDLKLPRNSYDVAAHQSAGIVLEEREVEASRIYEILSRSGSLEGLSREELDRILLHLDSVGVLRYDESTGKVRLKKRAYSYFYKVSMIPDEASYTVYDIVSRSSVGELSEQFVESILLSKTYGDKPVFMLGGRMWELASVDFERGRIEAAPVVAKEATVPSWEGEVIPVSYKVARELCSIITLCQHDEKDCKKALAYRKVPDVHAERFHSIIADTVKAWKGPLLHPYNAVVEEVNGVSVLHVCLGSNGNLALALLLSKLMEASVRVEFDYIPYAVVFKSPLGVPGSLVKEALRTASMMDKAERLAYLYDAVRRSKTYLIRFYRVAKRMGVVDPDKRLSLDLVKKLAENLRESIVETETLREIAQEKLDVEALNDYLDNLRDVHLVSLEEYSPLSWEVLENPYIKRDVAVKASSIAIDKIMESIKKNIGRKEVILVCVSCKRSRRVKVAEVDSKTRCPYCGALSIAPLPATEYGERLLNAYMKQVRGERLDAEEKKLAAEVWERAKIYLNYAGQGYSRQAVEALMAYGVGPATAKRILAELLNRGERDFYKLLLKAMKEYAANKQYWDAVKRKTRESLEPS